MTVSILLAYCMSAKLGVTLGGSNVKGDELSHGGPQDLFVNLYFIIYKKLHTVYPMLYKPTLKNSKN